MDPVTRAKKLIERVLYITLATASQNAEPRSTPVTAAFDEQYTFYWTSLADTQHSQNIRANPSIFFTIFDSTLAPGVGEGVYVKGRAAELSDAGEIEKAAQFLYQRKGKPVRGAAEFLGDSPKRIYKVVPEKVWVALEELVGQDPANAQKEISLV